MECYFVRPVMIEYRVGTYQQSIFQPMHLMLALTEWIKHHHLTKGVDSATPHNASPSISCTWHAPRARHRKVNDVQSLTIRNLRIEPQSMVLSTKRVEDVAIARQRSEEKDQVLKRGEGT